MAVIKKINLSNFRNFERLSIDFSDRLNILIGQNGQGKTNIIESIYLLNRGQSFRPSHVDDYVNKNVESGYTLVEASLQTNELTDLVQMQIADSKKRLLLNRKATSSQKLKKKYTCVLFSPESLGAIKNGPEQRRLLIDELLATKDIKNVTLISNFKKSMRSRNRILKTIKNSDRPSQADYAHLEATTSIYLKISAELILARLEALSDIKEDFAEAMKFISDLENVDISVDYLISEKSALNWNYEQIYNALSKRAEELKAAETAVGVGLVGPQKNEVKFLFQGEDSRFYCSQGQQRAMILSFKMAQILYHFKLHGEYPILLLDDVMSELDEQKRANLISFLKKIDSQIFITTTEFDKSEDFESFNFKIYELKNGQITQG